MNASVADPVQFHPDPDPDPMYLRLPKINSSIYIFSSQSDFFFKLCGTGTCLYKFTYLVRAGSGAGFGENFPGSEPANKDRIRLVSMKLLGAKILNRNLPVCAVPVPVRYHTYGIHGLKSGKSVVVF